MGIVDIGALVIIALGALIGFKKGAIKSLVQLVGLVAITIVAYQFKGILGNFFIKLLPFFNLGKELYALNILLYQGIAFAIIFILLYCVLNILVNLSGILDLLVKLTIVLELPSKIIGTILGAVEALVFVFVVGFVMLQNPTTQNLIMESKYTKTIVERTPVVKDVFIQTIAASEEVYESVKNHTEEGDMIQANLSIIRSLIKYGVVDASVVQEAIDNGKLRMPNVVVSSPKRG